MSAQLGAQSVKTAVVNIPKRGQSRAEVTLEGGAAPTAGSRLTLSFANLAIVMTVLENRTGLDASYAPACVLLSGAGWNAPIPPPLPSWQSDNGVPLRTVLDRLAKIAGETFDPATLPNATARIGNACALMPGTCGQALGSLVLGGLLAPWWITPDGLTRFGDRPGGVADPRTFEVSRNDSMFNVRRLRLSGNAAGLLPGIAVEGVVTSRVVFTLTPAELTARVWGP